MPVFQRTVVQPFRSAAFSRPFVRPAFPQQVRPAVVARPFVRPVIQQRVMQQPVIQRQVIRPNLYARPQVRPNIAPPAPRPVVPVAAAVPPASSWSWLSGPVAAPPGLPAVRSGSLRLGTVAPGKNGADVQIHITSARQNETAKFSIGAQVNGNWYPIYNIQAPATATMAWQTFTLHLNYDEINAYLRGVNPNLGLAPGQQVAIGATFNAGHNTGMPGWTSNNGFEQNIFVTLPAPA